MDRGGWQASVHGVTKSQMQLSTAHKYFYDKWLTSLIYKEVLYMNKKRPFKENLLENKKKGVYKKKKKDTQMDNKYVKK